MSNSTIVEYNFNELTVGTYIEGLKSKSFLAKYLKVQHFIQLFEKEIPIVSYTIIIFGSYAKEKVKKNSDVDITILADENKLNLFEDIYKKIRNYSTLKYDMHFFSYNDFTQMFKKAPQINVGTEIYENHVIVSGAENYLKCIRRIQHESS